MTERELKALFWKDECFCGLSRTDKKYCICINPDKLEKQLVSLSLIEGFLGKIKKFLKRK